MLSSYSFSFSWIKQTISPSRVRGSIFYKDNYFLLPTNERMKEPTKAETKNYIIKCNLIANYMFAQSDEKFNFRVFANFSYSE